MSAAADPPVSARRWPRRFAPLVVLAVVAVAVCYWLGRDVAIQPPRLLLPVQVDGRWGVIDDAGQLVVTPEYDRLRLDATILDADGQVVGGGFAPFFDSDLLRMASEQVTYLGGGINLANYSAYHEMSLAPRQAFDLAEIEPNQRRASRWIVGDRPLSKWDYVATWPFMVRRVDLPSSTVLEPGGQVVAMGDECLNHDLAPLAVPMLRSASGTAVITGPTGTWRQEAGMLMGATADGYRIIGTGGGLASPGPDDSRMQLIDPAGQLLADAQELFATQDGQILQTVQQAETPVFDRYPHPYARYRRLDRATGRFSEDPIRLLQLRPGWLLENDEDTGTWIIQPATGYRLQLLAPGFDLRPSSSSDGNSRLAISLRWRGAPLDVGRLFVLQDVIVVSAYLNGKTRVHDARGRELYTLDYPITYCEPTGRADRLDVTIPTPFEDTLDLTVDERIQAPLNDRLHRLIDADGEVVHEYISPLYDDRVTGGVAVITPGEPTWQGGYHAFAASRAYKASVGLIDTDGEPRLAATWRQLYAIPNWLDAQGRSAWVATTWDGTRGVILDDGTWLLPLAKRSPHDIYHPSTTGPILIERWTATGTMLLAADGTELDRIEGRGVRFMPLGESYFLAGGSRIIDRTGRVIIDKIAHTWRIAPDLLAVHLDDDRLGYFRTPTGTWLWEPTK